MGKAWTNAKKIEKFGLLFESKMELFMYELLKQSGIPFTYTESKRSMYKVLDTIKFPESWERAQRRSKSLKPKLTESAMSYTPDFIGENEEWFIEVKGRKLGNFSIKWRLFKSMLLRREPVPVLFMPEKKEDCEQVIKILRQKGYGRN